MPRRCSTVAWKSFQVTGLSAFQPISSVVPWGDSWFETGPGPYGYTAVLRTQDGRIHVAYDCDRCVIKEAVVDEAWFDEPAVLVEHRQP